MNKQKIIADLRRELEAVVAERRAAASAPAAHAARVALRHYQSQRMARTHADLLAAPASSTAARFFLRDLYGPEDLTRRDANLERIIPTMERVLPAAALATIAEAVALDALSEKLDGAMAHRLGEVFTEDDYIAAYRTLTARDDRERQLGYVESVGMSLCELVRIPLLGSTLAMMRGPAKLAKLGELQRFLERGFTAFKGMRQSREFVTTIVRREREIMERLYAGKTQPFGDAVSLG
ncbi:MAG: FFLEELY motif protein [Noviherbaspirillum sp.]